MNYNKDELNSALDMSGNTIASIIKNTGISRSTLYGWRSGRLPRNMDKYKEVLIMAKNRDRVQYHPSYGYVTKDQWDRLITLGICPERDLLIKEINEQNKKKGRI